MKTHIRKTDVTVFLFSATIAAFLLFFSYMWTSERVSVYRNQQARGYEVVTGIQTELISDDTAPVGVRKVYRWVMGPEKVQGSSLLFNIAHSHIQVYFDDTLVYALTSSEDNRIGGNVGSNWCHVYAGPERTGQTVTVILTPLFEAAKEKEPEFLFGSPHAVIMDVLSGELLLLVLSALSILVGVFMVAVSAYFRLILKTESGGLVYLGWFSITMGLWKITDLKSATLLLPEYSMAIGYISIGSLFLTGLCLLLYFSTLFANDKKGFILLLCNCGCLICLYALVMQLSGIVEIRQNLVFSHVLLIMAIVSIPLASVMNLIVHKSWGLRRAWKLLILLFIGIVVDLLLYYKNNGNGLLSFSIFSFIIYTLIVFLQMVQATTRKAYSDSRTGLENRARWNEWMHSETPMPEPYGILVVDMNGLKKANDTLGHDAGDRMIYEFSNILRNTLPRNSVLCRWGGDEFAAVLPNVDRMQLDQQVQNLFLATQDYNEQNQDLPIHFALGAALSAEHPGLSRSDLFHLADEEMYRNKQLWYRQKQSNS